MGRNIGPEDRVVRVVVALALALVIYLAPLEGVAGIVAGAVAAYLLVSGAIGRCLVYKVAGIDTSIQEQPYSTTDDRSGL